MAISDLLNLLPHEDIGWKSIGETFIRYTLLKTPWFRVYLHYLVAETAHPECHNHPWWFRTWLLRGGYFEKSEATGTSWYWRPPGTVLRRPASWAHNVITQPGIPSWSLVLTGPKRHTWGFKECGNG